jgi:hypothetical protein
MLLKILFGVGAPMPEPTSGQHVVCQLPATLYLETQLRFAQ